MRHCYFLKSTCYIGDPHQGRLLCYVFTCTPPHLEVARPPTCRHTPVPPWHGTTRSQIGHGPLNPPHPTESATPDPPTTAPRGGSLANNGEGPIGGQGARGIWKHVRLIQILHSSPNSPLSQWRLGVNCSVGRI